MAENKLTQGFLDGGSSLLFFFLLLVIVFGDGFTGLFDGFFDGTSGSSLLFFFLLLVIIFQGRWFF